MWDPMRRELCYVHGLRQEPLRLHDLARISLRKSLVGKHFKAGLATLPLPAKMKEFFRADIRHQMMRIVVVFVYNHVCLDGYGIILCKETSLISLHLSIA